MVRLSSWDAIDNDPRGFAAQALDLVTEPADTATQVLATAFILGGRFWRPTFILGGAFRAVEHPPDVR